MGHEDRVAFGGRSVSGVKWSSLSQFGRQGAQILTIVVLARLLSPSDFGLVSMAMVVVGFIALFNDLGTSAAVIQRGDVPERFLSSIFWVNAAFGLLATAAVFILSPLAAGFYGEPQVTPVLRLLSVAFLISGMGVLQKALLERELAFQKLARVELAAVLAGCGVGIGAALLGAGAWSLVFQWLVTVSLTTVLLWVANPWRPGRTFGWAEVRSASGYSLNLTGFNVFNYFARNADYILIGKFLGTQELGYYTLAYRLFLYPLQNISAVVGRVVFPVFSRMEGDDARFRQAYLDVSGAIALVTFPVTLGLVAVSGLLIPVAFGDGWQPVIALLVILAPVGLIQSVSTTVGVIYQAKGRTDLLLYWGVAAGTLIVLSFVIGLQWGIVGVAAAYACISILLAYPSFAVPFRLLGLRVSDLLAVLWRPLMCSLLMFGLVIGSRFVLPPGLPGSLALGVQVATGVIIYALAVWTIDRRHARHVLNTIRSKA